jgi:asparagine synthase (glutamine-hydrolysing)
MSLCGIALKTGARPIDMPELTVMLQSLRMTTAELRSHCCGDGAAVGSLSSEAATAACRRGPLLVACDADLYNIAELAATVRSKMAPDDLPGVLASLYLKHGDMFVNQLRGNFAIAVWNAASRTLLLARDRFGVKPLCYAATQAEVVFASHPRAIFAGNRIAKDIDVRAIVDYLNYGIVPAPHTAFRAVNKVNPGECVIWSEGTLRNFPYWEMQYPEDARGSVGSLAEELLHRMESSVRITSQGLDPKKTGCFLSGGTDSSSVVGLLTGLKKQPANTFSIGFAEERFNELEYAHIAARHFGSCHRESLLGPGNAQNSITKIVDAYDEPFANSSAIPTYWCAKLARESGIEVMLAGDGGDELFGGNERYRTERVFGLYQSVPGPVRHWLLEPILLASPELPGPFGKAQRYIRRSNTPNPERYCRWRLLQVFQPKEVLGSAMPHVNGDLLSAVRSHYTSAPASSELNRLLYVDVKMTLGDEDLPKVVRMTELAGVKVRFPYLDHVLAEFSGSLPAELKVRGLKKRYLFKRAMHRLLPEAILRKKKHGFGLPIGLWLKTDPGLRTLAQEVLLDPRTYQRGYFRRDFVEKLFHNLQQDDTPYFGDLLWVFLMLELWHRQHIEVRS